MEFTVYANLDFGNCDDGLVIDKFSTYEEAYRCYLFFHCFSDNIHYWIELEDTEDLFEEDE